LLLLGLDPATTKRSDLTPDVQAKIDALSSSIVAKGKRLNLLSRAGAFDPFNVDFTDLGTVGWAILFPIDAPQSIKDALAPLIQLRQQQAGMLFKSLTIDPSQQDPYGSFLQSVGLAHNDMPLDPVANCQKLPYYVLIVGGPEKVSFEFQRQLMTSYAVGRIAFDQPEQYAQYARSVVAYETATSLGNTKEVVYWSPVQSEEEDGGATRVSHDFLIQPLDQLGESTGANPVAQEFNFISTLLEGASSKKANLLALFNRGNPPALLFTASHGMGWDKGSAKQSTFQGALLCGDFIGPGIPLPSQMLAAADITDDATVTGMVMFMFACFGGGTPKTDYYAQFDALNELQFSQLADPPFVAPLPRRLLSHPNGSALAVIAHVERAWTYSIQEVATNLSEVAPFRECISRMLQGQPVGAAVYFEFSVRVCKLSATSNPIEPAPVNPLQAVRVEVERRDYWNYIVLGDPAVKLRTDLLGASPAQPPGDTPANT
jgi:hypothetical protein